MKKNISAVILLATALLLISAGKVAAQFYRFTPDSVYFYSYDSTGDVMQFAGANYNYYSGAILDSTYTTGNTGAVTAKSVYTYSGGLLKEALSSVVSSGLMVPNQKIVFTYDGTNLASMSLVTRWRAGQWENLNRFTYTYDESDRLLVYNREFWRNNAWTDYSADSLFYNELGQLTERSARSKETGKYITHTLYNYNMYGLKTLQTRQDFLNNQWVNVSRVHYYYNNCGTQTSTLTEKWLSGAWQKDSYSETFYTTEVLEGHRRFPVCHKGNTLFVRISQLKAHLAHGDCPGTCLNQDSGAGPKAEETVSKIESPPFIVYPNPVGEHLTIKMNNPDCTASRIELLDYYGRVVIATEPGSMESTTLDLSTLMTGNYILRVTLDTVYSTVISKK